MGAALTYARRYALFTLVGIAGEADLDASDLNGRSQAGEPDSVELGDTNSAPGKRRWPARDGNSSRRTVLGPEASAAMREQLVREVATLATAAEAAHWARSALPAKNRLTASDARLFELAFELRLSALEEGPRVPLAGTLQGTAQPAPPSELFSDSGLRSRNGAAEARDRTKRPGIDKSSLTIGEPRRYRDKAHLEFVASQPCLVCGRRPSDPHHLRFAQKRALGRRVSDEFTVPLCRLHHREAHRSRNECVWWRRLGLDSLKIAEMLWRKTRLPEPKVETETASALAYAGLSATSIEPAAAAQPNAADEPTSNPAAV
jgi:hypothetical protein